MSGMLHTVAEIRICGRHGEWLEFDEENDHPDDAIRVEIPEPYSHTHIIPTYDLSDEYEDERRECDRYFLNFPPPGCCQ